MNEPLYVMRVDRYDLSFGQTRIAALFTNGLKAKWDGPRDEATRLCHDALLASMSSQMPFDPTPYPKLRIGSGMEHDW